MFKASSSPTVVAILAHVIHRCVTWLCVLSVRLLSVLLIFNCLPMLPVPIRCAPSLGRYCHEEDYDAGDIIFSPGDGGDRFYIVTEGQVRSLRHETPPPTNSLSTSAVYTALGPLFTEDFARFEARQAVICHAVGGDVVACFFVSRNDDEEGGDDDDDNDGGDGYDCDGDDGHGMIR